MSPSLEKILNALEKAGSIPAKEKERLRKELEKTEKTLHKKDALLSSQARELEIEAALERVRTMTMTMHSSTELAMVNTLVVDQINLLIDSLYAVGIHICHREKPMSDAWIGDPVEGQMPYLVFDHSKDPLSIRIYREWKNGNSFHFETLEGKDLIVHFRFMATQIPRRATFDPTSYPSKLTFHFANFSTGFLVFVTTKECPEEHHIFKRFAKVFEQTYTRFLDLKKAEAQAREAQIEGALERVRTRTMAMRKSEELAETALVLYEQFSLLGNIPDRMSIGIFKEDTRKLELWPTDQSGSKLNKKFAGSWERSPIMIKIYKAWKAKDNSYVADLSGQDLKEWLKFIREEVKLFVDDTHIKGRRVQQAAFFSHGFLLITTNEPIADEILQLLIRFAGVFSQTYTRFLDLKKAEAQAREAKIESALEKVRSSMMAMHKTEELHLVLKTLFDQMQSLGLEVQGSAIIIYDENLAAEHWMIGFSGEFPESYKIPYSEHPYCTDIVKAWQKGVPFQEFFFEGDLKVEYGKWALENSDFKHMPPEFKREMLDPTRLVLSDVFNKYGMLEIMGHEPLPKSTVDILKRFSKVFEQSYTRFLDLKKAEAQAKEAQIEAALEKVRSASLAMHQSKDLHNVLVMLYNQLDALGLKMHSAQIIETIDDFKEMHIWIVTNGVVYPEQVHAPFSKNIFFKRFREAVTNGESFYTLKFSKRQKDNLFHHFFDNTILRNAPQARKDLIFSSPGLGTSNAIGKYTSLSIMRYDGILYSDEENEIIKRFLKVFEQSYTRFLDLQKAEAQAKEAQIEAALERVRSKAMAMHSSDDLADTVEILYKELDTLQVHALRFGHAKVNSDTKIVELHTATDLGKVVGQLKLVGHPLLEKIYEHYLAKEDLYYALQGEEMKSYYSILGRAIDVPIPPMDTVQHGYFFFLGDTANYAWSDKALDEEELKVYRRLISVLNLTYKRYEELKNAETQAREAQIEGALERVRSKTMAMHNSEDLEDIVLSLFDEVINLGLDKSIRCGIGILEGHEGMETKSVNSNSDGTVDLKVGMLNMTIHPMLVGLKKAWKKGKKGYSYEYTGKDVRKYYEALNNEPEYPFNADLKTLPKQEFHRSFFFSSGIIFAFSENPISEESSKILARFAAVFGQTYRRFLDLQKAEERAKNAVKQASLDRVRGQIASMRSAKDLERITPLVWNELTTLRIPFIRCGVFIINEPSEKVQVHLSAPDGHSLGVMLMPFDADPLTSNMVSNWRKGEVFKAHWNREQFSAFMQTMIDLGQIKNKKVYQGAEQPPESLHLHFVPFTQGMLYVGNVEPLEDEQIELIQTLADAFAIAYARYEDFDKLEKAKERVETALSELKTTQSQLVQSEKMASLGELTAGIAHEIQNPLNFVNNFSEVSVELIEEMLEEIQKGDVKEVKALAEDIIQNLEKINHHGKRADGIVKGMLQHSRASSGEKEPTDLNVLADEYLRLAYHGLRAKDKSFNATLETHFDASMGKVNVLPQDIGRVILNLITNAFYAVKKKKEEQPDGYEPTVTVATHKEGNKIQITVIDNGNGIPESIKEKIFQPFFTTKPTGQGTGLGLSMSYDIVTKGHGGELTMETKKGQGTTFLISIPFETKIN